MSFPVVGGSVAIVVHLTAANCNGTAPTALNFTPKEASRIFGGDAKEWADAELVATNPSLKECKTKITRVVREDTGGATTILKYNLARVDNERTGAVCAPGKTWESYNPSTNTIWPGKQEPGKEGECSEIVTAAKTGNPELGETEAGIGYSDYAEASTNEDAKNDILAHVQNATGTEFVPPNTGKGANCDFRTLSLPGLNAESAVGLNPEDNWATDNKEGNRGNAPRSGQQIPDLWTHLGSRLYGPRQRRGAERDHSADGGSATDSLLVFWVHPVIPAQETVNLFGYAPLPVAWVGQEREGFQANF
jgi:PBP superfamily domain